jgi:hypothetical protein
MTNVEMKIEKTKNSLHTDRLDLSIGEIVSMYEREEINAYLGGLNIKKRGL